MSNETLEKVTATLREGDVLDTYWGKRIVEATERGYFEPYDRIEATSWVTCACGRVTANIGRDDIKGIPDDPTLRAKGVSFNNGVVTNNFEAAAEILVAIEIRASIVAKKTAMKVKR